MNNIKGFSSVGMVMLLLLCGGLMLGGLQQQLNTQRTAAASESAAIKAFTEAEAALAWASQQGWEPTASWQCRSADQGLARACIVKTAINRVMIAGQSGKQGSIITLWQAADFVQSKITMLPHRWADFCPFREEWRCRLP